MLDKILSAVNNAAASRSDNVTTCHVVNDRTTTGSPIFYAQLRTRLKADCDVVLQQNPFRPMRARVREGIIDDFELERRHIVHDFIGVSGPLANLWVNPVIRKGTLADFRVAPSHLLKRAVPEQQREGPGFVKDVQQPSDALVRLLI